MLKYILLFGLYITTLAQVHSQQSSKPKINLVETYARLLDTTMDENKLVDTLFLYLISLPRVAHLNVDSVYVTFVEEGQKRKSPYWEGVGYLASGFFASNMERYDTSVVLIRKALLLIDAGQHPKHVSFAYSNLARNLDRQGKTKESYMYAFRALNYAEAADEPALIANVLNFIGLNLSKEKKYRLAKTYFIRTLENAFRSKSKSLLFTAYTNLGINYKNLGNYDSSYVYHQLALQLAESQNNVSDIAYAKSDLGNLALITGNIQGAIQLLHESVAIRESLNERWELGYTYNFLGTAYSKSNKQIKAEEAFRRAIAISFESNNIKQRYESYQELSNHFERYKRFDSALYYERLFSVLRDSVSKAQTDANTQALIASYGAEIKEQTIQLLKKKSGMQELTLQTQQYYLYASIATIVVLLILAYLIYINRQQRIQKNALVAKLNEEQLRKENEQRIKQVKQGISSELHDNLGLNLLLIKEQLNQLHTYEPAKPLLDLVHETMRELRQSVWLIHHEQMSLLQWVTKLREYVQHYPAIRIEYTESDTPAMVHAVVITELFRVVKEGIANTLKHSQATQITLHIASDTEKLSIAISDNGKGINNPQGKGFGMKNMEQRITRLSGTFDVHSTPQSGTRIEISIPWNQLNAYILP